MRTARDGERSTINAQRPNEDRRPVSGARNPAEAWDRLIARWNSWQRDVKALPPERIKLTIADTLDFRMSHRLFTLECLGWFIQKLRDSGAESIQQWRHPMSHETREHDLAIFSVCEGSYAILRGHHRIVAACLAAQSNLAVRWQTELDFAVYRPGADVVVVWEDCVPAMDAELRHRFTMVRGAQERLGSVREYAGDWSAFGNVI